MDQRWSFTEAILAVFPTFSIAAFGYTSSRMPTAPKNSRLENLLANLPQSPGIYQMKDTSGKIIYVGKSVNLKSRVGSYFSGKSSLGPAKRQMVERVADIEIVETRTETEALVLETNLIKEIRPKYNVLMKDDKDLAYVRISSGPVASVEKTRTKGKEGKYF